MTKNELQEAFMESLSLDEGNRNHKKILYGKAKPDLDNITTIPGNNCIDILYDLFCNKYYQILQQDWFSELDYYEKVLSKVGVHHLKYVGNFYYVWFKYMFDNHIINKASSVYKDLDMSTTYSALNWLSDNPNNVFFPSEKHVFPLIDHAIVVNRYNNQLLGVTHNRTLVMTEAFQTNFSRRNQSYIDIDDAEEDVKRFISLFLLDLSIKGEPKIKEEISFYKDMCGVDLT